MKEKSRAIDRVRASRDGHEFHEAWAARKALQLVMPTNGLVGIAVEGLAPADQVSASAETVEIADLVLYYGRYPTFDRADSVIIVQVKYSRRLQTVPFRASDAKKTIRKFAVAYRNHKSTHGAKDVEKKLAFELITNRPIDRKFAEAIEGFASGVLVKGDAKKQARQFASACGLKGKELIQFAQKVRITGLAGTLRQNKQYLSRVLADWSVAPDAMARVRLGAMRQLLREKAGLAGERQNVVTRTDVLDALELQSADDLFPCPASFPEVGIVVEREQLCTVVNLIPKLDKPLLVHAAGGIGKTVFLQSLSKTLSKNHETVLFDCFGGGAYRAPEDARHLPKRGLIHIINNLAYDGLCDPLLPINENVEELVKAFRARLSQAVATLRRGSRGEQLFLFLDAIDNAAEHAKDKGELAFPKLLLESFHHSGPVPGVRLIVSCRTHRREIARGDIPCEEFELQRFSPAEAQKYLRDRIPGVTDAQMQVAWSRSAGNPRILEHLALSDRGLLDPSEIKNVIKLDDLLRARIQRALEEALKRGYKAPDINAFLAGLAVLPPPVPLDEYADAHGMELSAVMSFAADLAPLLEQTKHGLMFRDEPTETLVREAYAAEAGTLGTLAENLFKKQGMSVYAASALPGLLQKLDDGKRLFELAFDDRFPHAITSTVGQQNIRYTRLKAAVLHAARKADFNSLVNLLVELSTLAAVNERGTDYVIENPDLAIASHDIDATRRLFETRTRWPGTRHARLAIASALSGDVSDAYRHAVSADEWIRHFYEQNDEYRRERGGPERPDIASIPLCLVAQNRGDDAARFMKGWKDWYAYEVAEDVFSFLRQAQTTNAIPVTNIPPFLDGLKSQPGALAAALSFLEPDNTRRRFLIKELAKTCATKKTIETNEDFLQKRNYIIRDGLLKAAAIAVALKMHKQALVIASTVPHERPGLWSFRDRFSNKDVSSFIAYTAVRVAAERQSIVDLTLLPQELVDIGARVPRGLTEEAFRKALKAELEKHQQAQQELPDGQKPMSYDTRRDAERFIDEQIEPLLEMSQAFAEMLSSSVENGDKPFLHLLDVWAKLRRKRERYSDIYETNLFFDRMGRQFLIFSLWARSDLKTSSVEAFVTKITEDGVASAPTLVEITAILSKRCDLQELAGKTAIKAKTLIEREDEVGNRASLFARLARAIMAASFEETASYFRAGLEQMDAIGSGDYEFTNELLLFTAELKGDELEEADFHTLSNICELNMPAEEEKFPWFAFARGLSRTSGLRTLAKLCRWDDRDKISLNYTLLPYLTALIEQDKIDPAIALALLRTSDPVELYACGTEQLAKAIEKKRYSNSKELVAELILQFEQNHPGVFMPSTLASLSKIAERELGKDSKQSTYLSVAAPKFERLRDEENDNRNYHGALDFHPAGKASNTQEKNRRALKKILDKTDPSDEASMSRAIDVLNGMQQIFDLKSGFFESLRDKVKFSGRAKYVQIIARLDTLDINTKLQELKACKEKWGSSSTSLENVLRDIGTTLIQINTDSFVTYDYLSGFNLKEVADLSGISMPMLALELISIFAAPDSHWPASIWIGLASVICERTANGAGQAALRRLLNSSAAKLASSVVDGVWKDGLYPKGGQTDIAAGLIWLTLGSPWAAHRWRSAHSIRCLARFGKWEVVDALVSKFQSTDAHPFQAPELSFYFLHARLWLLIGLARTAIDFPQKVAKYADVLKAIALDRDVPHVLLRHFAVQALLICADGGGLTLSEAEVITFKAVNQSPFLRKKTKEHARDSFYQSRPASMPKPKTEFHLDYDFDKTDVARVSDIFDRSGWETKDAITGQVRKYDQKITTMYESGGRRPRQRDLATGMNAWHHLYGQQLGWHALFVVAGDFLARYPVVQSPYDDEDPWCEWLKRELLTRNDGLWLADGIDRPPLDAQVNLKEKGEKGLVLTGDKKKLLGLLGIESSIGDNLVVGGAWRSVDNIGIHIASALVPPSDAKKLGLELSREDPFRAWLPRLEEYEDGAEHPRSEKEPYEPWIVWPSPEMRLDETDPLGANSVMRRLYFAKSVNAVGMLKATDPFKRAWTNSAGKVVARSEAWGGNRTHGEAESISGERFVCSADFLQSVLAKKRRELLLLIILRQYDQGFGSRDSQFWHTTAVIRVKQSLKFELFPGVVNRLHETRH